MKKISIHVVSIFTALLADTTPASSQELYVEKSCPVLWNQQQVGILIFSQPWFHNSRSQAAYIPKDDATGIGVEIHFMANKIGHIPGNNAAKCQQYRFAQFRETNASLAINERARQMDIPPQFSKPFYDTLPLEFGRGTHTSPSDLSDKPWSNIPTRAATVSMYDTPYVSDGYGQDGHNITVKFETCVVCQRESHHDDILSCGTWGFTREYIDEMSGWAEPEPHPFTCQATPTDAYLTTLDQHPYINYRYWLDWR